MAGLDSNDGGQQLLLGKMLLERGLITPDQLREALVERARNLSGRDGPATPLGGILVRKGYLTDDQLSGLMAEQGADTFPSPDPMPARPAPPIRPPSAPPLMSGPTLPAMTVPDPMQESGFLGKYKLVRELGRGGMGVVYEAIDTQLNRKVALKLMLSNPNADPKERALEEERFIQEAQLSAKLKHPHIVTVYEAGLLDGRQFLSMEMIEGSAFNDWRKTVTIREQVRVLSDVSGAVHHAHEQGILHRDLKPRNILVSAAGHAYVTDFGLAKSLGKNVHHSLTGSGAVVGTPAYMSPEQAQGLDRVDWRTDIYSLGVVLYECMTGRTPFTGESPIEILMKVVKDPVVPPLQMLEAGSALGLDKGIENICLKALAKKDRDRYVTAQAFADDLRKWLAGEKVHVVAPKTPGKSNKRVYLLVAGLFLALMAGLAVLGMNTWKPSIQGYLDEGKRLMAEENYSEAMIQYRVALASDPDNMEAVLGAKAAQEGIHRKDRDRDERLKLSVIEKFREAEEKQLAAAEILRKEKEAASEEERLKLAGARRKAEEAARKAQEAADKAEADFRRTQALVVVPPGTTVDAWKDAINLLPIIEPRRNAIWGTWEVQEGGRLASDRSPFARIEIPFQLPQEYDFRMVFERRSGSGSVNVILSRGGRQFRCEMGGEFNTRFAFESVKPPLTVEHPAVALDALCLRNDVVYTLLLQVRADGAKAFLNGKQLLAWKTDYADIGLHPEWKLRNTLRLGVGSHESETIFHRMELLEVTGKGRKQEPVQPPPMKSLAVVPAGLKPGLLGEYFIGTSFQSLALRRVDSNIDFRWNEGPAWPTGPSDSFSVRWNGYLHVPRTGRYFFSTATDDGIRVAIGEQQILASWNSRTEAPRLFDCTLEEGYHRITIEYYEMAYLATMVLSWANSPTAPALPIPAKSFFHPGGEGLVYMAPRMPEFVGTVHGHSQNVTSLSFQRGGKVLAVGGEDRKVRLIDPATLKDLGWAAIHPAGVLCVAFAPDGVSFATGARDSRVRIWDSQNRNELRTLEGPTAFITAIAYSPDGKLLAAGSYDSSVRIWTVESQDDPLVLTGHTAGVESVAFSRDGKVLATAARDATLRLWNAETGKEIRVLEGHADYVESVVFSPGGRTLASAGWDGLIKLWDLDTGRELKTLAGRGTELVCVAFSPDGLLLAAGGNDGTVRVWDPLKSREVKVLPGHTARVTSLAFAPTGRILVSGSADATVRFWNLDK